MTLDEQIWIVMWLCLASLSSELGHIDQINFVIDIDSVILNLFILNDVLRWTIQALLFEVIFIRHHWL